MSPLLDIFPIEIWHLCWKNADRASLLRLCRTCTMFRDICQPILFHTRLVVIPWRPSIRMELDRALALSRERFLDVAMHPRLAHYVRSLLLMDQLDSLEPPGVPDLDSGFRHLIERFQASILTDFLARLSAFANLQSLRLYCISLMAEGRQALDALSLVDLQLNGCTIASGRRLPLERLTISSCFNENETEDISHEAEPGPLLLADPHTLQDLYLDGGTTSRRAHVSLLRALCEEPGPYPRLRSLQLELTGLSEALVLPFLEKCKNITTFSPMAQSPVPPFALPAAYLPNVHVVSCAHRFVDYLLPGRNIKTLQLLRSGMDVNGNDDPPLLTTLSAVGTACGRTLEELVLRSPIADQELSAVFDLVQSTLLRLRELTITLECESSGLPVSGFMAFIRLLSTQELSLPPLLKTLTVLVTTPTYRLEFSQIYELVDMRELAGHLVGENLTTFVLQYEGETDICRRDIEGQWALEQRKLLRLSTP